MIIIYCSKPQQTDAATPTPLAHRSHTCIRALELGHHNFVHISILCFQSTRVSLLKSHLG